MIYQNWDENLFVKVTENNNYLAHMHRQVEIFYVLDGAIEITISGQKMCLEKGMVSIAFLCNADICIFLHIFQKA